MRLAFLVAYFCVSPAVIILLCLKVNFLRGLGPVVLSYLIGMTSGYIGVPELILGETAGGGINAGAVENRISEISVALGLPLLLFTLDIKKWVKMAGKSVLSLLLGVVSISAVITLFFFVFKDGIQDAWKIAGMLVGVYTGGTPNLASLKIALGVDQNTYILVHTYDTIFSTIYIIFLIMFGRKVFSKVLPLPNLGNVSELLTQEKEVKKQGTDKDVIDDKDETEKQRNEYVSPESIDAYPLLLKNIGKVILPFVLALFVFSIGGLASLHVPKNMSSVIAILTITTLGIAFSFVEKLRKNELSFTLGMYIILIFCFTVANMVDFKNLVGSLSLSLFLYVFCAIFIGLLVHVLISAPFKIDTDETIITSTALICSPPFVPVIATALKNRNVLLTGMLAGIVGYAIGNYLGIGISYALKNM